MHLDLPKALRGWREFLKEYVIVVLGVLTALALGEVVESAHDRRLAREAQNAINQELQTDLDRVAYRARQQSCNVKRLAEIQSLLANWHDDGAFPAGLHVGFPGDVGLVDQRWQANLASGRFSEQSPDEQADQASIYTLIHVIDMVENREIQHWLQLRALEFGSQSISMASKPMIAEALANARGDAEALNGLTAALLGGLRTAGSGRPGMTPSRDYMVAYPGTACEPMRKTA
jgi:type II secretory pathway pseudopilin PulG